MRGRKSVRPTEVVGREGGEIWLGSVELTYVGVVRVTQDLRMSHEMYLYVLLFLFFLY